MSIVCSTVLVSCNHGVTAKEFMQFVKDEANGRTRTFGSAAGPSWTVTIAPKEYMALTSLRTNRPASREFEAAATEYSDMTYLIIKTNTHFPVPISCESFFMSACEGKEPQQALMCQQVVSGIATEQEFLLGFPPELSGCPSVCVYIMPEGFQAPEQMGCIEKSAMKELPSIKLY